MATITAETVTRFEPRAYRVVMTGAETSKWIHIDSEGGTVVVSPTAGTMRAEITCSLPSIVQADNANGTSIAIAIPWPDGDVGSKTQAEFSRATAVRFVSTVGGIGEVTP